MENKNEESRVGITMNKREENRNGTLFYGVEGKNVRERKTIHKKKTKTKEYKKRTPKVMLASELRPRETQFLRLLSFSS